MKYRKLEYNIKGRCYDFECYSLNHIENKFGLKKKFRVGRFLSLLYKKKIRIRGIEYGDKLILKGYVYVSNKELEGILGSKYWKDLLNELVKDKVIKVDKDKKNKFNSNKQLTFIRLDDNFFSCNKSIVDIEDGLLNKYLDRENKKQNELFEKKYEDDELLKWEKYSCVNSNIEIKNIDEVIELRCNNKINEDLEKLNWSWLGIREKNRIENNFKDIESWKNKYKTDLKNYYNLLVNDLDNLKNSNWLDFGNDRFKRDGYGKRMYNIYSNTIREFREYIKIDGEEVVELDIKSCFLSLFYLLIKQLNDDVDNNLVKDIKSKILKESKLEWSKISGSDFLKKFKSVFQNDGVLLDEKNDIEVNDYYDFMRLSYGVNHYIEMSRSSYKELVFRLLFSKEVELENIKVENKNISQIQLDFFGLNGVELMYWLRRIKMYDWIKKEKGLNKKHYSQNNISLILMIYENRIMDIIRSVLYNLRIKNISVFDSLLVKKSDYKKVLKVGNETLNDIDECLVLRRKYKEGWRGI